MFKKKISINGYMGWNKCSGILLDFKYLLPDSKKNIREIIDKLKYKDIEISMGISGIDFAQEIFHKNRCVRFETLFQWVHKIDASHIKEQHKEYNEMKTIEQILGYRAGELMDPKVGSNEHLYNAVLWSAWVFSGDVGWDYEISLLKKIENKEEKEFVQPFIKLIETCLNLTNKFAFYDFLFATWTNP